MLKKNLILLPLLILLPGLSACGDADPLTVNDPRSDHSFIDDQPCPAPCWYGLEVGKSTQANVDSVLEQLPFIDQQKIEKQPNFGWAGDPQAEWIHWSCKYPRFENCGDIFIAYGNVNRIEMDVGYELTLREAIGLLGEPDKFGFGDFQYWGEERGVLHSGSWLELMWLKKGIMTRHENVHSQDLYKLLQSGAAVPPNTRVTRIIFASPSDLEQQERGKYRAWPGLATQ